MGATDALSLHDALPIFAGRAGSELTSQAMSGFTRYVGDPGGAPCRVGFEVAGQAAGISAFQGVVAALIEDRKSTRLNSSHVKTSYAVFCLQKKNKHITQ